MKHWVAISVLMAAASIAVPQVHGQRTSMRLGGGAAPRISAPSAPMRLAPAPSGFGNRGTVRVNPGFVPLRPRFIDPRFVGAINFGHNPRFHVFFGNSCFVDPFCRHFFFRSQFFNSGFFNAGFFPPVIYPVYGTYQPEPPPSPGYEVATGADNNIAYQQGALAQQVQDLTNEVERLRAENEGRANPSAYPGGGRAGAGKREASVQELPLSTTLVFKDGHRLQIHNYAIVGDTLWLFNERTARKISIAQLDLDATKRVNEENGVQFLLPGMR